MCRWLAYSGSPVLLEELLIKPTHSLIDQSLHSRLGAETTNGDGFGVGWFGEEPEPGCGVGPTRSKADLLVSLILITFTLVAIRLVESIKRDFSDLRAGRPVFEGYRLFD